MFAHPCTAMVRGRAIQNSLNPFSTSTPCSLLLFFSFVFILFLPSTSLSPPSPATLSYPSPSFTLTPHLSTSPCPLLPISLHLLIHSSAPSPLFHSPTHPFHTTLTLLPSLLVIPSFLPITCLSAPRHLQCQFPSLSPFQNFSSNSSTFSSSSTCCSSSPTFSSSTFSIFIFYSPPPPSHFIVP